MLRVFLLLAAGVSASWAQGTTDPVYQTNFSDLLPADANSPIDGGGKLQSGFTASHYSAGAGVVRMRLVPLGEDFPPRSDPSTWGESAFISEAAGTNPATTIEEAVNADAYIEFTLHSDNVVDFTRIEFSMAGAGSNKSGALALRSSADNFSSDLVVAQGALNGKLYPSSADLDGLPGFDNVREITFRFYIFDEFEGNNNRLIGVDEVRVWAVPALTPAAQ